MEDPAEVWLITNLQKASSLEVKHSSDLFTRAHGLRFLKAISEISFFGIYGTFDKSDTFLPSLRKLLVPIFAWPDFFSAMRFNTDYATLFLSLCDVGLRLELLDPSSGPHILKLCGILRDMGPERVPFRQLDLLYGLTNLGFSIDPTLRESALASGCFGNAKRVRNLTSSDGYALTHNIFYLTDFGRNPENINPELLKDIICTLKRLSAVAISENNMDLLAEYILCFGYLNSIDEDTIEFSDHLRAQQRPEGYWEGPVQMTAELERLAVPPQLYSFYSNYHTTLLGWQAAKSVNCTRRFESRKVYALTTGGAQPEDRIIAEVRGKSLSARVSPDFSFVIWIANQLNFGFQEELDELARALTHCSSSVALPSIRNLRFVAGLPIESEQVTSANGDLTDDVWEFARLVSNESPSERCYLVSRRLALEYERNRSAYVRVLALGIASKAFSILDLKNEMEYVDSLYSSDRNYLWQEVAEGSCDFVANTALIGRILLKAFSQSVV